MLAHAYLAVLRCAAGGEKVWSTSTPICCRSPYPKYAACCGVWSGPDRLIAKPRAPGHVGDAATSSEPAKATGNEELPLKPGCSTCTAWSFWDTGLKPTLPERAVEAVAGDIRPG